MEKIKKIRKYGLGRMITEFSVDTALFLGTVKILIDFINA
jgi:hypothetical protein